MQKKAYRKGKQGCAGTVSLCALPSPRPRWKPVLVACLLNPAAKKRHSEPTGTHQKWCPKAGAIWESFGRERENMVFENETRGCGFVSVCLARASSPS